MFINLKFKDEKFEANAILFMNSLIKFANCFWMRTAKKPTCTKHTK